MAPFASDAVNQRRQKDDDAQHRLVEITVDLDDGDEVFDNHDGQRRQKDAKDVHFAAIETGTAQHAGRDALKGEVAQTAQRSLGRIRANGEQNGRKG